MAEKNKRTFAEAKKNRVIPEKVRELYKHFREMRKSIRKILAEGPQTIPQIAEKLKMSQDSITYHLMTCRKYGDIEVVGMDDMDEYYIYGLSKKEDKDGED